MNEETPVSQELQTPAPQEPQDAAKSVFKVIAGDNVTLVPSSLVKLRNIVRGVDAGTVVKLEARSGPNEDAPYVQIAEGLPNEVVATIESKMLTASDYAQEIKQLINMFLSNSDCIVMEFAAYFAESGIAGASAISKDAPPSDAEVRQFHQGMVHHAELFKNNMGLRGYKIDDSLIIPATTIPKNVRY
jgi:hypothetical protein